MTYHGKRLVQSLKTLEVGHSRDQPRSSRAGSCALQTHIGFHRSHAMPQRNCQFGFNSVLIGLNILAFFLNIAGIGGLSGRLLDERQKSFLPVRP